MSSIPTPATDFVHVDDAVLELIIDNVPIDTLVQMARDAARLQDVRVLSAMVRRGWFCFEACTRDMPQTGLYSDEEFPLVAAWACVIEGATLPQRTGHGSVTIDGRRLACIEAFEDAFLVMLQEFMASHDQWEAAVGGQLHEDSPFEAGVLDDRYRVTLVVLLAAAIAMDHERAVQTLLPAVSTLVDCLALRSNAIGLPLDWPVVLNFHGRNEGMRLRLSPLAMAIEFAPPRVMALLARHGIDVFDSVASLANGDGSTLIQASGLFLVSKDILGTTPEMLQAMVARAQARYQAHETIPFLGELCLRVVGEHDPDVLRWRECIMALELYRHDLGAVARKAFLDGDEAFLRAMRSELPSFVAADQIAQHEQAAADHPVLVQWFRQAHLDRTGKEQMLANVLSWLHEDGAWPVIERARSRHPVSLRWPASNQGGELLTQPGDRLIDLAAQGCMDKVLLRMLELGCDPVAPNDRGLTVPQVLEALLARAEQHGSPACLELRTTASMLRAWMARDQAHQALGDAPDAS